MEEISDTTHDEYGQRANGVLSSLGKFDYVPEQIAHCSLSGRSRSNRIVKTPAGLYDYF